ncbi:Uncharacterised protein [Mycobacteroides abscessus subsp. abscessus]|nr:Uncharacterised protein [Mycobacteroides abscessus subsp. abscessus]
MPARTQTPPRQVLGSVFTAWSLTPRPPRPSSGSIACMPMVLACASSHSSSPTMECHHRANTTRHGTGIVTHVDGPIRRSAPFSTTLRTAVSVSGASRRSMRSF